MHRHLTRYRKFYFSECDFDKRIVCANGGLQPSKEREARAASTRIVNALLVSNQFAVVKYLIKQPPVTVRTRTIESV